MHKRLLFVSPVVPALGGSGVAMRAGCMIEALSRDHCVFLLVVPIIGGGRSSVGDGIAESCEEVRTVALHSADPGFERLAGTEDPVRLLSGLALYPRPALFRLVTMENLARVSCAYEGRSFDVVHAFRLYSAPFAEPYMARDPQAAAWLDLDELESETHRQLAAVHALLGDDAAASLAKVEATKYVREERSWLSRFERLFVASARDAQRMTAAHPGLQPTVVPNAIRLPARGTPAREAGEPAVLFVGSMSYAPNEDAAIHFCRDILPEVRLRLSATVRVWIVGNNPTDRVRALARDPEVVVTGRVSDLSEYYQRATVVVVPLRGGCGTRIKILEAFAHRRPVVSTSKGAEGLEAVHGEHLLIADTPPEFSAACAELCADPESRARLAAAAFEWAAARHTVDAVARSLSREA